MNESAKLNHSNKKILVIEDNLDIRLLIEFILGNAGFTVLTAVDGPDGLSQTKVAMPDLILLDVMMPGLDGFEVLKKIRNDKDVKINTIPILMLTSRSSIEDIDLAIELGTTSYMEKPFRGEMLISKVESIFQAEAY